MKYFKGSLVVGGRMANWPKCSECGKADRIMSVTIDYKNICDKCRIKDERAEETDKKYGEVKENE